MNKRPKIVLIPWGTAIEDFLDTIGRTLPEFRTQMTGGWLFNYAEALQMAGIEASFLVFSSTARDVDRSIHLPTGAEFYTLPTTPIARLLRRSNHRHSATPAGHIPSAARRRGGLTSIVKESIRYLSTPTSLVARTLREAGVGAVLCQDYEWERFDRLVRIGRGLDIPVFGVFQGGSSNQGTISRVMRRTSIRMSAGLIIGSQRETERVRREYELSDAAIGQFPNPVPINDQNSVDRIAARADLEIPDDAFVVAWHGRVELHPKGLDLLADAWHQLATVDTGRPKVLVVVGSGSQDAQFRALLGPRLHDGSVRWINEYTTDRKRLFHFVSSADVYAFPSRVEGFPVAPIEGMSLGLALVAAQAHGVDEIVPRGEADGAIRIPANDAAALADALRTLAQDPARVTRLRQAARQRIVEGFGMGPVGRAMRDWLVARGLKA